MATINISASRRYLSPTILLVLSVAACGPPRASYLPTPPAPQVSTRPVIQYSLTNVSPESWSTEKGTLKVFLDTETGPATLGGGTYRHLKYQPIGAITASTSDVDIAFGLTHTSMRADSRDDYVLSGPLALRLIFKNKGTRTITLDWNSVVLTDELGRALRVIHRGVKLSDAAASMAPSVVPPGSILEDFVYPSEGIRFSSGRYGGWYGALFFETRQPGAQLKIYLPLKLGAEEKAYTFTFMSEASKE